MDDAAAAGYFDILKYLHLNRKEGMSCYGFNYAAANGHFEVIRFLHENRSGKMIEEGRTQMISNLTFTS